MSLLIRVTLALLVALPPGTFRTLNGLSRRGVPGPQPVAAARTVARRGSMSISFRLPAQLPGRVRTWADGTYIPRESPQLAAMPTAPWLDEVAVESSTSTRRDFSGWNPVASPRHAHQSPRAALVALCDYRC